MTKLRRALVGSGQVGHALIFPGAHALDLLLTLDELAQVLNVEVNGVPRLLVEGCQGLRGW